MNPSTNEEIKAIIAGAKTDIAENGALTPMFFVHGADGKNYCLVLEILDGQKEALAHAMRGFAKSKDAEWTCFVTECYMKKFDNDEKMPAGGKVSQMPGREEGVLFSLETKSGGDFTAMALIKYKADEKVLDNVEFVKGNMGSGTFANLLPEKKAA
jgi:hypothetical protein